MTFYPGRMRQDAHARMHVYNDRQMSHARHADVLPGSQLGSFANIPHHERNSLSLQDRMHLDCVFSIIGDDVCIMMDEMMGEESPTRRLVDEWVQVSSPFDIDIHHHSACQGDTP